MRINSFTSDTLNGNPTPWNEININIIHVLTNTNVLSEAGIAADIADAGETIDRIVQERYLCALLFAGSSPYFLPGGEIIAEGSEATGFCEERETPWRSSS